MKFNIGDIIESVDGTISTVTHISYWNMVSAVNKSNNNLNFNFNGEEVGDQRKKNVFRVISKNRPLEPDVDNNNLFVTNEFFREGNYIDVLFNDVYAGVYDKDLLLYKTEKFFSINAKKSKLLSKIKWAIYINLFQNKH